MIYLRELQVTECSQLRSCDDETENREAYSIGGLLMRSFRHPGITNLVFSRALQVETVLHKSQLIYLEALDNLMQYCEKLVTWKFFSSTALVNYAL